MWQMGVQKSMYSALLRIEVPVFQLHVSLHKSFLSFGVIRRSALAAAVWENLTIFQAVAFAETQSEPQGSAFLV